MSQVLQSRGSRSIRPQELAASTLLLLAALVALGPRPALIGFVWLAAVTPRLIAVDIAEHRLPDALVLPGYPVVLAAAVLDAATRSADALPAVLVGAGYGALLLVLHLGGGMGFGDVKLAPLLGAVTAVPVLGGGVLAIVLAFLAGGVAAVGVLLRQGSGSRLAFGPPMLLGAWAAALLPAAL